MDGHAFKQAGETAVKEETPFSIDEKGSINHPSARPMNDLEQHVADTLDDSWETESLLNEMLEGLTDEDHIKGALLHQLSRFTNTNHNTQTRTRAPPTRLFSSASNSAH